MATIRRDFGSLDHDGERLYWESAGHGGTPLVLCHGAGGNHAVWYQQVPVFAESRRVVAWDHRGFGRSTARKGPTTPALAADDLEALLDHLGIETCDLVGQSMGGWTALGFAIANPARVRRLVLADTPGGIDCPEVRTAIDALQRGPGPLAAPPELGVHPAVGAPFSARDRDHAYLYSLLGGFGDPDLAAIAPPLLSTRVADDALASVRTPTLFVVGSLDTLFPPAAIRAAAARLPDGANAGVVEIPETGHSPYFEDAPAWNRAVAAFLG